METWFINAARAAVDLKTVVVADKATVDIFQLTVPDGTTNQTTSLWARAGQPVSAHEVQRASQLASKNAVPATPATPPSKRLPKSINVATTLTADDAQRSMLESASSTPVTITIPTHASAPIPVGASIEVWQVGNGVLTIAGAPGVTVNGTVAGSVNLTRYSRKVLRKRAVNEWLVA